MASEEIDAAEARKRLYDLRLGKVPRNELYRTLHGFGRTNLREARSEVEGYLSDADAELRYVALEVLTVHWHLDEHWSTARKFLETDPFVDNRAFGAKALASLMRDSKDSRTLDVLARVVRNTQEATIVREAAYSAMMAVLEYDTKQQLDFAFRGVDLSRDINWGIVNSYAVPDETL